MNYIKRLESENAELTATVAAHADAINELKAYLLSSKFHTDPTVQTRDVMHRLDEALRFNLEVAGL